MKLIGSALVLAATVAIAQPAPEDCLVTGNEPTVETARYAGREYRFKIDGCKAVFDSDPERYAQLYDALLEMSASGEQIKPPSASLVPS